MVFKSKKDLLEPLQKSKDKPGPGEYIPQTQNKNIKLDHEPFLSTINGTFQPKNDVPGPGSYYQDNLLIKYLKNIQNQKISDDNEKKSLAQSKNNILNDEKKVEKLGFNSKSKRFNKIKSLGPGPCYYFPKLNKFYKNKTNRKKEDEFSSKKRLKFKIQNVFNLIPTIPSKSQKFGFDILKDGQILQKKDPNLYKIFTGEKGDTVGPGAYEVQKKNELYKTRPQWTMSKEIRNCYITNAENMSKIEAQSLISTNHSDHSSIFNNSNLLSSITANNFYIDEKLNVIELSPYNISNYNISNYESQNHLNNSNIKYNIGLTKKILNKNSKTIINNKSNNQKFKKISSSRPIFEKRDNFPGPGFYIDHFKRSDFAIKNIPECNQFFGSRIQRFKDFNNSYDNFYGDDNSKYINNIKSKSLINFAPFSTSEERFRITSNILEKYTNPSPCDYSPKTKMVKSFSNNGKFNTCAKRFIEDNDIKSKNEAPGPGCYNPEKIKKHINIKKFTDDSNNNQLDNHLSPINYNINTIEYINDKKLKSTNLKNVTFFKCNPKFSKSLSCQRLGPGSYYHDKKSEFKQILHPFNKASEKRVDLDKRSEIKTGPGKYNHESYFDWNKKTFNISYL